MIRHSQSGLLCDPATGVVYGKRGRPFTSMSFDGYPRVAWGTGGRTTGRSAHRVIYEAVYGPIPDGLQINHINGIKADNRIDNLELVTPSENIQHALRMGLHWCVGEKVNNAKLTADQAAEIRMIPDEFTHTCVGQVYGVDRTTISRVRRNVRWMWSSKSSKKITSEASK